MTPTLCECGCGRETLVDRRGKQNRFLVGHSGRPVHTEEERIRACIPTAGPDECWEWLGYISPHGYGSFNRRRPGEDRQRPRPAHRVVYELLVGPIPEGLTLDHLCRNRACVNPAHLEPVTNVENILRGESPWAQKKRQTECVNGHPYDERNTRWSRNGTRRCRECARLRAAAHLAAGTDWRSKQRALRAAA